MAVCEHGRRRRGCPVCERDEEIAELRGRIDELESYQDAARDGALKDFAAANSTIGVAARVRFAVDYAQGRTVPWVEISRNVKFWADVLLLCDEIDRLQTAVEPHFLSGVVVERKENDNVD